MNIAMEKYEEFFKNEGVFQYRKAAKCVKEKGYYTRGRCFFGNHDLYVLKNGKIEILCYNTTKHRMGVVLRAFLNNTLDNVEEDILRNYVNNGYMTRRGLFADYSEKKKERITRIADSHRECYMPGKEGHDIRVRIRN